MKIESIKIKNFKAIAEENLTLKGNNVYLLGANKAGKTSFIDAVFKIISGKDLPSKIVKDGEKNGLVELDLGKIKVKATFNAKNEKISLTVENEDGAIYKSPRTMLDEMAGVIDFDVNSFFNLSTQKQIDFIKKISGIDFTDLDAQYNELYQERTFVNKKVKELEVVLKPVSNKTEPIDISALQDKIQAANNQNSKIKEVAQRQSERAQQIIEIENKLEELKGLQMKAALWLKENTEVDITELKTEFDQALIHNKEVAENLEAIKLKAQYTKLVENQDHLNFRLQEIQDTKKRIIKDTKMPVDGLTFDDDQLLLDGLPFEKSQINTAQQIITGLQINLALLKDIKIARFDGSLLDNSNIKAVEEWAKKNDLQLFVEFVERNAEGLKIEVKENE